MPAIAVKKIPGDLYRRLKRAAKANRRSIKDEILVCLERQLRSRPIDPEEALVRARQLRERTRAYPITDEAFNQAKAEGRP